MKRITLYFTLCIVLSLFYSCHSSYTITESTPSIDNFLTDMEIMGVQYIRTDGYNEAFVYPRLIKITSVEALDYYFSAFDGIYSFGNVDASNCFADAISKYDKEYFKSSDLYLAVVEEGSGSIRHFVKGVEDGYVEITSLVPEVGTDDMAEWHIIIEVNKDAVIKGINKKETPIYTPYEIYSEFLDLLEMTAVDFLDNEFDVIDTDLLSVKKTDFGEISKSGYVDPLGYSPGYPESPVWQFLFTVSKVSNGELFPHIIELYLCDTPFVFGYKYIPS